MNSYMVNTYPSNVRFGGGMGFGRPGFGRPGFGRPGFGRPGFGRPWFGGPWFGGPFGFGLPFITGLAAGALLTPRPVPYPPFQPFQPFPYQPVYF